MNRIFVAGNLIIDQNNNIIAYPSKGMLSKIVDINKDVGGFVPNYSINFKKLDPSLDVVAMGLIGDDENGNFIIDKLNQYDVDTSLILKSSFPTSFTLVMNEINGERTFFQYGGSNDCLSYEHFNVKDIECDLFHIGYLLLLDKLDEKDEIYGTKLAHLLSDVRKKGIRTSIDIVSKNDEHFAAVVIPSLKYVNYMVINEIEAGMICGLSLIANGEFDINNAKKAIDKLFELGIEDVVCIHSPKIAIAKRKGEDFIIMPSLVIDKKNIVNSSGAGDAFCSGFLYSIIKDKSIEEALSLAHAAALGCLLSKTTTGGTKLVKDLLLQASTYKRRSL